LRLLPKTRPFASGNLNAVSQATQSISASRSLPRLLFAGVVCWQFLAVLLFGWAVVSSLGAGALNWEATNAAFLAGLGLWAGFLLADEMLTQYETEHSHVLFFMAQLLTLVAVYALPA
jgi:hypothetical protein